jgi:hypothetical protein
MHSLLTKYKRASEQYVCISGQEFAISGNRYSDYERKYVQIEFKTCRFHEELPTPGCIATDDFYQTFTRKYYVEVTMINSYFHHNSIDSPISNYLTEKYYYSMEWNKRKDIDIFLKENHLYHQDDLLQLGGPEKEIFYSVTGDKVISRELLNPTNFTMYINLKLDQDIQEYERRVNSLADTISKIGGIYGAVQPYLVLIVGFFVERLFYYSVLRR